MRLPWSAPFDIGGRRIGISASFGVALYPQDGDTPAALMGKADAAMYVDKHARQAAGDAQ